MVKRKEASSTRAQKTWGPMVATIPPSDEFAALLPGNPAEDLVGQGRLIYQSYPAELHAALGWAVPFSAHALAA